MTVSPARPLRAGDAVRVRTREEILATLDPDGRLDALPFMPEMLAFAGREMRVSARADKTCDTIGQTGPTRRMSDTVHLAGARCDGSAHGGCQARCLLFFKQEWLEHADSPAPPQASGGPGATEKVLHADTLAGSGDDGAPRYRCQATELLRATTGGLGPYHWQQYITDVRTGNERPHIVLKGLSILLFNIYQRRSRRWLPRRLRVHGGDEYPFLRGTGPVPAPEPLNLEVGELVEVRRKEEILATLGPDNRHRGMVFDVEELLYCGTRAQVLARVEKIIDEPTGRMLRLRDCVILEGVTCLGAYHRFCKRSIYPYWREAWLRRVEEPAAVADSVPARRAGTRARVRPTGR